MKKPISITSTLMKKKVPRKQTNSEKNEKSTENTL